MKIIEKIVAVIGMFAGYKAIQYGYPLHYLGLALIFISFFLFCGGE